VNPKAVVRGHRHVEVFRSMTAGGENNVPESLVRKLLTEQAPSVCDLPLTHVADGWDNAIWRLGENLAVRLTRRPSAVDLHAHEQRWLPQLAPGLTLPVPTPVVIGRPSAQFPWPWSVVPWYDGDLAAVTPPARTQAPIMGGFLASLHRPAPEAAPRSDFRGVPLALRQASITAWTQHPRTSGDDGLIAAAVKVFEAGLAAAPATDRVWLHGDLHPRNILVRDGSLAAVLDWGDMTAGDAATDLAVAWWLFDLDAHGAFWSAYGGASAGTWHRARAWAAVFGLSFLNFGLSDAPETPDCRAQQLARDSLERVVAAQQPPGMAARSPFRTKG
jgi:aminoglycoside phosphotransferase (APT) family kinase protein